MIRQVPHSYQLTFQKLELVFHANTGTQAINMREGYHGDVFFSQQMIYATSNLSKMQLTTGQHLTPIVDLVTLSAIACAVFGLVTHW